VIAGLVAVVVALVGVTIMGVLSRRRAGRFRPEKGASAGLVPARAHAAATVLTREDLGETLGDRATLVQFSSAFCAPCRGTRQVLSRVADMVDGVRHVEIDVAARVDLVKRLRISTTPTVLVLDSGGGLVQRATGLPRTADVIAAVGAAAPGLAGKFEAAE
jgi:thiol-disulfide isomerase/thioredoxin